MNNDGLNQNNEGIEDLVFQDWRETAIASQIEERLLEVWKNGNGSSTVFDKLEGILNANGFTNEQVSYLNNENSLVSREVKAVFEHDSN